ncbi:Protein COBRA precursor, putative [Ricinus communis]|uniref:Protein COBRA, putative n=1 Tax=Ricinus communis TaxID=3988 RepID=B9SIC3_RICCO|nr:Protein COBRA precursor, putative [Ricinus communis]
MKFSWRELSFLLCLFPFTINFVLAQDYDGEKVPPAAPAPAIESCNGIFLSYQFLSRTKEYPRLKNASAQSWSFKSVATILNTGTVELEAWKIFIGFQHREILVSASGAVLMDSKDFPADVSNGTYFSGSSSPVLKTAIDTAGDLNQIQAQIEMLGTQFGVKPPGVPLPKTIKLITPGYTCPELKKLKTSIYVCCVKDKKYKAKDIKTKFIPRQKGDLSITWDVTQAYESSYLALVTMENNNPLGRLDHWNLTWEWMRGEFIYSMKGAYTRIIDYSDCIYGAAGKYYGSLDFSKVMNCQKKPIISDLPPVRANDTEIGKIPNCCRNGTLLPKFMDPSQSKAAFQLQVYKLPPDMNRTALYPPQKWNIVGVLNPEYKCGAPIRVSPTAFPDPSGLQSSIMAIATWQVVCNITKPKTRSPKCCVSFSAYYNDSVIPCNTCACGCQDTTNCDPDAPAMFLPSEALLVPFANRSTKAVAWARLKHFKIPKPLPCSDNCGVSINWHISTDYKNGWSARITLFNWQDFSFENWFTAIQLKRASRSYEKAYSFNGTLLREHNNTIFLQGLVGLNYLVGEINGTHPRTDPRVPGKQQTVISFTKKFSPGINIAKGDGFPSRVLFNGEECTLPKRIPIANGNNCNVDLVQLVFPVFVAFVLMGWINLPLTIF